MKKLIAIAVVFALVAGAAFAETSVSGSISVRGYLLSDTIDDADPADPVTSGEVETAYIQLSGQNDDGTFGALIRMRGNDAVGKYHRAFVWWKPIPMLNIFFGQDPDGKFGPYNAWSFYQGQEGIGNGAHDHDWGHWRAAFPGNWDDFGLAVSLYPVAGVEVNLVVPAAGGVGAGPALASWESPYGSKPLDDIWLGSLQLATAFSIPDIGKVFFNLLGPGENIFDDDKNDHYGEFGLSFLLTAVQGLDVQLGFSTKIPGEVEKYPAHAALIANYGAGDFGVKFRSRFVIGPDDAFEVGADVQPYYNLGILKAFLNIGFISTIADKDTDPKNQLIINPYIRKSVAGGDIRLGLIFKDPDLDNDNDAIIKVPVQFTYSF